MLIRKVIAGASVILGSYWLWAVLSSPVQKLFSEQQERLDYVFLLTLVPFMAIPGALALIFGIRLYRTMSIAGLKWVLCAFSVVGAIWISAQLSLLFPGVVPGRVESSLFMLVGTCVVVPAYVLSARRLLAIFQAEECETLPLIGRGVLILIAWQLWLLLSAIFEQYTPIQNGYTHVPKEPWGLLGVFAPMLIAYGLYRLAAARLFPSKAEPRVERG